MGAAAALLVALAAAASAVVPAASLCNFQPGQDYNSGLGTNVGAASKKECCSKCTGDCGATVFMSPNSCWIKKAPLHGTKNGVVTACVPCTPPHCTSRNATLQLKSMVVNPCVAPGCSLVGDNPTGAKTPGFTPGVHHYCLKVPNTQDKVALVAMPSIDGANTSIKTSTYTIKNNAVSLLLGAAPWHGGGGGREKRWQTIPRCV